MTQPQYQGDLPASLWPFQNAVDAGQHGAHLRVQGLPAPPKAPAGCRNRCTARSFTEQARKCEASTVTRSGKNCKRGETPPTAAKSSSVSAIRCVKNAAAAVVAFGFADASERGNDTRGKGDPEDAGHKNRDRVGKEQGIDGAANAELRVQTGVPARSSCR